MSEFFGDWCRLGGCDKAAGHAGFCRTVDPSGVPAPVGPPPKSWAAQRVVDKAESLGIDVRGSAARARVSLLADDIIACAAAIRAARNDDERATMRRMLHRFGGDAGEHAAADKLIDAEIAHQNARAAVTVEVM